MRTNSRRLRRRGWWLLELGAALTLGCLLLFSRAVAQLGCHRAKVLDRRRRVAYFFVRGVAAEVACSRFPPDPYDGPVVDLVGVQRELPRLDLSPRARADLAHLRLTLRPATGGWLVRVSGRGVLEERVFEAPW